MILQIPTDETDNDTFKMFKRILWRQTAVFKLLIWFWKGFKYTSTICMTTLQMCPRFRVIISEVNLVYTYSMIWLLEIIEYTWNDGARELMISYKLPLFLNVYHAENFVSENAF